MEGLQRREDGAWEMHLKNGDGGKEYSTKKMLGLGRFNQPPNYFGRGVSYRNVS
jgi:hypothetical protein